MADLKIGKSVTALRMSNKAVLITGTIDALNDDGQTVVVKLDDGGLETVHADDVSPLPSGETKIDAGDAKSFTTVNGKAI